jgi:hypothetical protein
VRMVSDASKKKAASKKAAAAEKRGSKAAAAVAQSKLKDVQTGAAAADAAADEVLALAITDRTCTGVLASHPQSRDIHVRRIFFPLNLSQFHNSKFPSCSVASFAPLGPRICMKSTRNQSQLREKTVSESSSLGDAVISGFRRRWPKTRSGTPDVWLCEILLLFITLSSQNHCVLRILSPGSCMPNVLCRVVVTDFL